MTPTDKFVRAWHDAGFKLIRLRKRSKLPLEDDWAAHTKSPKEIARWISTGGNWAAIIPASFVICDADSKSGGREGLVQFKDDSALDIEWDEVPTIRTGGRNENGKFGRHCVFRKPPTVNVIPRDKKTNLEWRSSRIGTSGKYIVGPGSVHPDSSARYHPLNDVPPAEAPMLPRYWLDRITKKPKTVGDGPRAGQITADQLAEFLAYLDPHDFDHNDSWLPLLFSCHAATDSEGCDQFVSWSTQDNRYASDEETIRARWESCDANEQDGITARTLYRAVIDAGCPLNLLPGYVAPEDDFTEVEVIGDADEGEEL